jgi:hypothetical protein
MVSSPSTVYPQFPNSTPNTPAASKSNAPMQKPLSPTGPQPDAEYKLKRGWNEGVQENKSNKAMTVWMGIGCLLMNFIPGLRMKWSTAFKMALANMALMAAILQGFGMKKGYQKKTG